MAIQPWSHAQAASLPSSEERTRSLAPAPRAASMVWRQSSRALEEAWVSEPECPLTTHLGGRSEVSDDPAARSGQGRPCSHLGACSKHGKTYGSEKPVDVQALRKKVSGVTCGPAARAVLSSLLLYITDLQDRPPEPPPARRAEGRESRAGHSPESRDAHRRPTCFQLLQAKFMGTGREPRLKKAREVGRLISKDKQGPGGSLVTATINKLLDKAREGAGRPTQDREPPPSQKPRQGLPAGKGAVKNILKKFLAAEKKEVCEEPTAAGGPLPKPTKRGSMLSKLREKFERSGCLCSEAGVLPLCAEGRRRKNPARRKTHRPETRVLSTAAIASTCLGTPLARFLACTAEPALAFSIATVVCGPQSWLSHCAKISHSRQGRVPTGGTGASLSVGVIGDGQGQPGGEPTQPPAPWATARGDSLEMAFLGEGAKPIPGLARSPASHRGGPLPGHEPSGSLLKPASPGRARAVGGDGMGNPPAEDTARHTMAHGEAGPGLWPGLQSTGPGVAPKFALTVCSSEDEAEGVSLGSEEDPLFALQETFPEQKVAGHIPPLPAPAVQALQGTQSALESPQITVTRPVMYQMPPPAATLPKAVASPHATVPRPDPCQGPPPAATLPKAVASPHATVPRPDPCQGPPPAATLPKAVASPHATVPRPDPCQGPPPAATLPKAVASPHTTVPRPDPCQGPPPAATLPKAVASPHATVPRPDPCQGPPPAATLPKAVASPHATVPRPDPCQGPPPAATLPKAEASPHATVPRPDPCQGPPPAATLPKAVASPHATVPRPDPCQGPPPAATLPKAVASPHATVPRPDPCQGPPPAATLPKAEASPHATVPRPDPCQGPPPAATLPKAVASPHVTVPWPDMCQVPTPPATLPKAMESPHVTVPPPDTCQMPPGLATLPQASGGRDRGSSLLSSEGRGRGGLESARGAFPMGTGSENIRAASTVGGPLQVLSVPPARDAASMGQDLRAAAPQQRPTQGMANTHSFGDSKELQRPEGPAGEDVSEPACKKRQWPASGDRLVHGRDAPWHHSMALGNRQTGDSPSAPAHQRELPTQAGHPAGVSAALGTTPSDRTQSDSSTTGEEKVLCGRELGELPRGDSARPGAQAAGSTSPGLGSDRHGPLSECPQPAPGAPRREAATRATESHTAPEAGNVLKSVDSVARGRDLVQEPGCCPPPALPSLAAVALTRAPSPPHSSAPPRCSEHLLKNSTRGGSGQRWPEPPESPAAVPLQAADTPLRPAEPRVSVVAESKASVVAGGRGAPVVHGSPQGGIMTRIPGGAPPTPQGSAAVGPPPSGNQQAEEDKHVLPKDQVPPRAGAPCRPPPPGTAAGQRVGGAPQKGPDPQAHPPSVPLMRAGVQDRVEVGDRHQPRAGLGALEEGAAGPVRLDGPPDRRGALWGQKSGPQAAEEGQTQPREVKVGRAAEVGATEVGTGHQCTEKGPEHAWGQRSRPAERPPWGHSAQAGENQEPSPPEKPGHPAQAQAGRTVPRIAAGPADSSSEAVSAAGESRRSCRPAPGGSQAEAGAPHQAAENQPMVGRSLWSSGPEPASDSAGPTPKPGGCEMPCAPAQEEPPEAPEAESGAWERARRRRLVHFAKYRAQSFGDQRSFDLSFRPTTIRANDTFELPK